MLNHRSFGILFNFNIIIFQLKKFMRIINHFTCSANKNDIFNTILLKLLIRAIYTNIFLLFIFFIES